MTEWWKLEPDERAALHDRDPEARCSPPGAARAGAGRRTGGAALADLRQPARHGGPTRSSGPNRRDLADGPRLRLRPGFLGTARTERDRTFQGRHHRGFG